MASVGCELHSSCVWVIFGGSGKGERRRLWGGWTEGSNARLNGSVSRTLPCFWRILRCEPPTSPNHVPVP